MQEFSLVDKLVGRPYTSVKEVLGKKIEFRILSTPERVSVWRKNGTADLMSSVEAIAIPTIARAILSVDGVPFGQFSEIKNLQRNSPQAPVVDLIEQYLSSPDVPFTLVNMLYGAYVDVVNEQQVELDKLKKNSTLTSPDPSGSSAEPLEKTQ